jgi:hypothetical protein
MRFTRHFILAAALCALFVGGAAAQGDPEVENLEVVFWPEFDTPDMLIIYRITLSESTALPASVSVPIPSEVGSPHAVAVADRDGSLYMTPYTLEEQGDWVIVTLEASTTVARVEFYADLEIEGENRSFIFEWPGGLDVGEFSYDFQQPAGAGEPTIDPPFEASRSGLYGLTYFSGTLGALDADSTTSIQLSYIRQESGLTADFIQQGPPLGRPDATQGETPDVTVVLMWIGIGLAAVLIVVVAFMLIRLRQERESNARPRRRQRSRGRPEEQDQLDAATVFCHSCVRQAGASDRYCRSCGSQLRR